MTLLTSLFDLLMTKCYKFWRSLLLERLVDAVSKI